MVCGKSKASDQPHMGSLIRAFACRLNILLHYLYFMSVNKLLLEHYLEFLSLKGDFIGSSESTFVKMPHSWKSHAMVHM